MQLYFILQEKIDKGSVLGAPMTDEYLEILQLLFPPGDIELAVVMEHMKLESAAVISERAGVSLEQATKRLEGMADRGVLLAKERNGEMRYALLSNAPGLFEYSVMKKQEPDLHNKLIQLWGIYKQKTAGSELVKADPKLQRIIPVEATLPVASEILPYETASQIIAGFKYIALGECACRLTYGNCDRPKDTCIYSDGMGRFLVERGIAKEITYEEAIEVLKRANEAGLIHTIGNNIKDFGVICNCCACCCHSLKVFHEYNESGIANSSYEAIVDQAECTGCGVCVERCHFKAIEIQEAAVITLEKCYGCGLCVTTCPTGALSLQKREHYQTPPANGMELVLNLKKSRE